MQECRRTEGTKGIEGIERERTFHDVDHASHLALLYDPGVLRILDRVHRVDDLGHLASVKVLHEVVLEYRLPYQILRAAQTLPMLQHHFHCRTSSILLMVSCVIYILSFLV